MNFQKASLHGSFFHLYEKYNNKIKKLTGPPPSLFV